MNFAAVLAAVAFAVVVGANVLGYALAKAADKGNAEAREDRR